MAAETGSPALSARVSNRLSRYFCTTPFRLRNQRPMVSFTFDDFPESAAAAGTSIFEQYDAKATFYVAGDLVDKWCGHWQGVGADAIVELHRRGHEIGCHTFSHSPATDLDAARFAAEIEKNRRYLLGLDPSIEIENFAYPYGLGSVWRKTAACENLSVVARHYSGRQPRHRGPALSAFNTAGQPSHRH